MDERGRAGSGSGRSRADVDAAYRTHSAWTMRLATSLVGPGDAPDLVHDVFAAAARRLPDLDEASWRPYLTKAIVNRARSRFRRDRVARRFTPGRRDDARSAEELAVLADHHRTVLAAVDELSPQQRVCVVLRFYEDLDEAGIAETTGLTWRTVRTHLDRALARLGDRLEPA